MSDTTTYAADDELHAICKHGGLKRNCEPCEQQPELVQLRADIIILRAEKDAAEQQLTRMFTTGIGAAIRTSTLTEIIGIVEKERDEVNGPREPYDRGYVRACTDILAHLSALQTGETGPDR